MRSYIVWATGFAVAIQGYMTYRRKKREDLLRLQHGEDWWDGLSSPKQGGRNSRLLKQNPGKSGWSWCLEGSEGPFSLYKLLK